MNERGTEKRQQKSFNIFIAISAWMGNSLCLINSTIIKSLALVRLLFASQLVLAQSGKNRDIYGTFLLSWNAIVLCLSIKSFECESQHLFTTSSEKLLCKLRKLFSASAFVNFSELIQLPLVLGSCYSFSNSTFFFESDRISSKKSYSKQQFFLHALNSIAKSWGIAQPFICSCSLAFCNSNSAIKLSIFFLLLSLQRNELKLIQFYN